VIQLQLAGSTIPAGQAGTVTVTAHLLSNFQEVTGQGRNDLQISQIPVNVTDTGGHSVQSHVGVTVKDDIPSLQISSANHATSVIEGQSVNGAYTLVTGADTLQSLQVGYTDEHGQAQTADITHGGTVHTQYGELTFDTTQHSWSFAAHPNVVQAQTNPELSFTLIATDKDGDQSQDHQALQVTDGTGPSLSIPPMALVLREAELPQPGHPTDSTQITLTAGSDNIVDVTFVAPDAQHPLSISGYNGPALTWTASPDGHTLTGSIPGASGISEQVLQLTLGGDHTVTAGGSGTASVTATLLGSFAHTDALGQNSLTITGLKVTATDTDQDQSQANVAVKVIDAVPTVTVAGATTIVEGSTTPATGTWHETIPADITGATTTVIVGGYEYNLGTDIAVTDGHNHDLGTLNVKTDGTWSFTPESSVSGQPQIDFQIKVTDGDRDVATDHHTVQITDGTGPQIGNTDLKVDEANLPGAGTDDVDAATTTAHGTMALTAGTDAITDAAFGEVSGITLSGAHSGLAVHWEGTGTDSLIGKVNGQAVIELHLTGTQTVVAGHSGGVGVTVNLLHNFEQVTGQDRNDLHIDGIKVVATDADGSAATGNVGITVKDDVPQLSLQAQPVIHSGIEKDIITQQHTSTTTTTETIYGDQSLIQVLDLSGSMKNSMGQLKDAAKTLVEQAFSSAGYEHHGAQWQPVANAKATGDIHLEFVTFSTTSHRATFTYEAATHRIFYDSHGDGRNEAPPGWTLSDFKNSVDRWVDGLRDGGNTNHNAAIQDATRALQEIQANGGSKTLVFITDGQTNGGGDVFSNNAQVVQLEHTPGLSTHSSGSGSSHHSGSHSSGGQTSSTIDGVTIRFVDGDSVTLTQSQLGQLNSKDGNNDSYHRIEIVGNNHHGWVQLSDVNGDGYRELVYSPDNYWAQHNHQPLSYGATIQVSYANSLGLPDTTRQIDTSHHEQVGGIRYTQELTQAIADNPGVHTYGFGISNNPALSGELQSIFHQILPPDGTINPNVHTADIQHTITSSTQSVAWHTDDAIAHLSSTDLDGMAVHYHLASGQIDYTLTPQEIQDLQQGHSVDLIVNSKAIGTLSLDAHHDQLTFSPSVNHPDALKGFEADLSLHYASGGQEDFHLIHSFTDQTGQTAAPVHPPDAIVTGTYVYNQGADQDTIPLFHLEVAGQTYEFGHQGIQAVDYDHDGKVNDYVIDVPGKGTFIFDQDGHWRFEGGTGFDPQHDGFTFNLTLVDKDGDQAIASEHIGQTQSSGQSVHDAPAPPPPAESVVIHDSGDAALGGGQVDDASGFAAAPWVGHQAPGHNHHPADTVSQSAVQDVPADHLAHPPDLQHTETTATPQTNEQHTGSASPGHEATSAIGHEGDVAAAPGLDAHLADSHGTDTSVAHPDLLTAIYHLTTADSSADHSQPADPVPTADHAAMGIDTPAPAGETHAGDPAHEGSGHLLDQILHLSNGGHLADSGHGAADSRQPSDAGADPAVTVAHTEPAIADPSTHGQDVAAHDPADHPLIDQIMHLSQSADHAVSDTSSAETAHTQGVNPMSIGLDHYLATAFEPDPAIAADAPGTTPELAHLPEPIHDPNHPLDTHLPPDHHG
jgi:hypothetical protein